MQLNLDRSRRCKQEWCENVLNIFSLECSWYEQHDPSSDACEHTEKLLHFSRDRREIGGGGAHKIFKELARHFDAPVLLETLPVDVAEGSHPFRYDKMYANSPPADLSEITTLNATCRGGSARALGIANWTATTATAATVSESPQFQFVQQLQQLLMSHGATAAPSFLSAHRQPRGRPMRCISDGQLHDSELRRALTVDEALDARPAMGTEERSSLGAIDVKETVVDDIEQTARMVKRKHDTDDRATFECAEDASRDDSPLLGSNIWKLCTALLRFPS